MLEYTDYATTRQENTLCNEQDQNPGSAAPGPDSSYSPDIPDSPGTPGNTEIPAAGAAGKRPFSLRFAALLVAVCMLLSAASGFGGVFLAAGLLRSEQTPLYQAPVTESPSAIRQAALTVSDGSREKMSVEDVVAGVKSAVVEISTETVATNWRMRQFISTGAGSGVLISPDGFIATNNHVVSGAGSITVRMTDGSEYAARLVGTDAKTDLAVIKIDVSGFPHAVLGSSAALQVGQSAIAIGNPLGELGGTVTAGIISALDRAITIDGETMSLLQTDTAINPGNSGGGLFNLYGELVGIINAKSSGTDIEGLGFAIPIDTARGVLQQIMERGYVSGRVDTGLTLIDVQDVQTAMYYRVNQLGLYVSQAPVSELQSGDRITAVDGQEVGNLAQFNEQINLHAIGDTVTLTVVRRGNSLDCPLTLREWQA